MSVYTTLLLRGHCAVHYMEASKKTKLEARLARAFESLSWTNCTFLGLLWLRLSHHRFRSLHSQLMVSPWVSTLDLRESCIPARHIRIP